jgi:WD40 repeat protein
VILWKNSGATSLDFKPWKRFQFAETIRMIAWRGDSAELIIAGPEGKTQRFDTEAGKTLGAWPGESFALSGDGRTLAVADSGIFADQRLGVVTLHAMPGGERLREIAASGRAMAFSENGTQLAVAVPNVAGPDAESRIAVFALAQPELPPRYFKTTPPIWSMNFSPDGTQLAAVPLYGREVAIWDTTSGHAMAPLVGHNQRPCSCQFIDSSSQILTTGADRTIRLWRAADHNVMAAPGFIGHENEIRFAALNPAQDLLASGDKDGVIRLWNWPGNVEPLVEKIAAQPPPASSPADATKDSSFICSIDSPDGRWHAVSTWQNLSLTNLNSGERTTIAETHHWANRMVFHPNGKCLVTAGIDGNLKIWSIPQLTLISTLKGHLEKASDLAISPDGLTLASIESGEGLRLWRLDTMREVIHLELPQALDRLYFSDQGRKLSFNVKLADGTTGVRVLSG